MEYLSLLAVVGIIVAISAAKAAWDKGEIEDDEKAIPFFPNMAGEEEDFNPGNPMSYLYEKSDGEL